MTEYEKLINLSNLMVEIARVYYSLNDERLGKFYKNASIGYKEKALKLNIC